jgi:hypothetical protein
MVEIKSNGHISFLATDVLVRRVDGDLRRHCKVIPRFSGSAFVAFLQIRAGTRSSLPICKAWSRSDLLMKSHL